MYLIFINPDSLESFTDLLQIIGHVDAKSLPKGRGPPLVVTQRIPKAKQDSFEEHVQAVKNQTDHLTNVHTILLATDDDLRSVGEVVSDQSLPDPVPQEEPSTIKFALQNLEAESPDYL